MMIHPFRVAFGWGQGFGGADSRKACSFQACEAVLVEFNGGIFISRLSAELHLDA